MLDRLLRFVKKIIPEQIFRFFQPVYHKTLSLLGAFLYGFPAESLKVIAVTGTKGKSTVVVMLTKIFEDAGFAVASLGSLGTKIKDETWPNTLKMTMPGRFKLQKFLAQARDAGAQYVFLEATSEGIAQHRLTGVRVECAVLTNLRPEHIESHGSFVDYKKAKEKLFTHTSHAHVLNADDPYFSDFARFKALKKITFGMLHGQVTPKKFPIRLKLLGDFNQLNALASMAVAQVYGLDVAGVVRTLEQIESIDGRMEYFEHNGKHVIVDYAHTPDSLENVLRTVRDMADKKVGRLIAVFGAAGGGRDRWKRPVFGRIGARYADEVILTNEDPFDENPDTIISEVNAGIPKEFCDHVQKIMDRREAIETAILHATAKDYVVITGKGSEVSMALAGGKKIPWSDKTIVLEILEKGF